MTTALAPPGHQPARATAATILIAGTAGGLVNLVYASAKGQMAGQGFARVWQGVASGWVGRDAATEGGAATAALGLATHFGIATAMAAAYVLWARRVPLVARRPYATAPAYGLGLYAVMYLVVLPLRWPGAFPRWRGLESVADVLAHVGVAIAIAGVAARPGAPR